MIKVNICGSEHECDSSLNLWINEQFHNRRKVGAAIWFIISIETNDIKLKFPSADAPCGRGVPYSYFNHREQKIIDIWNEMDLKQDKNVSNLLRFLGQIQRAVA